MDAPLQAVWPTDPPSAPELADLRRITRPLLRAERLACRLEAKGPRPPGYHPAEEITRHLSRALLLAAQLIRERHRGELVRVPAPWAPPGWEAAR